MARGRQEESYHTLCRKQHRRRLSRRDVRLSQRQEVWCHQHIQVGHHNRDSPHLPPAEEAVRSTERQRGGKEGHRGCHRREERRRTHLRRQGRLHLVYHPRQRGRTLLCPHPCRPAAHRLCWIRHQPARGWSTRHGEGLRQRRAILREYRRSVCCREKRSLRQGRKEN